MEQYTQNQMAKVESLLIAAYKEVTKPMAIRPVGEITPSEAFFVFTFCLIAESQHTPNPKFTQEDIANTAVYVLEHYQFSPAFPFTNEQISEAVHSQNS